MPPQDEVRRVLAASAIANRIHERHLARVAGVTFTVLATVMLVSRYIL